MDIKIHRGSNQIGGSIVEVATAKTRILLDAGTELEAADDAPLPEVNGLFENPIFDAVFFSHNHLDHIGLAKAIDPAIPLFTGEKALAVMQAMYGYLGKPLGFECKTYRHNEPVTIGDIKVTPFIVDHSAFDAYMLLVEADGESVLYSGDFRSTGRKPFEAELKQLPDHVDVLICEGTNLGAENKLSISETDLEEQTVKLFRTRKGPVFVLQAATNIDRIVTMYRSAKRSGRIFIEDLYMAEIANAAAPSIPNPTFEDVHVFIDRYYEDEHLRYALFNKYGSKKIGRTDIAKQKFVLCIRTSMGSMLRSLAKQMNFEDGLMVYSMWNGYKAKPQVDSFLKLANKLGLQEVTIHNSGHADIATIEALIDKVNPDRIIPIHTENAAWFERFSGRIIVER
jgi:ribonuclease J